MFAYLFCFKVRNKREKDVSIPRKRKEEDASKERTGLSPSSKKPHRRRRREISFAREEVNARVHIKKPREYRKHRIQNDAKSRSSIRFYLRIAPSPPLKKNDFFSHGVKREREGKKSPPPAKTPTKLPRSRSKRRANTTRIRRHPFSFARSRERESRRTRWKRL